MKLPIMTRKEHERILADTLQRLYDDIEHERELYEQFVKPDEYLGPRNGREQYSFDYGYNRGMLQGIIAGRIKLLKYMLGRKP